jgi:hypothetical protein
MAERPAHDVSDRYSFVPTFKVIELLEQNGWYVNSARETNAREHAGFQKHVVRFRREQDNTGNLELNEVIPEAIMTNAHNRTSRFNFMSGFERCWCTNQCTVSEGVMASHQITHVGYTHDKVIDAVNNIIETTPKVLNRIEDFRNMELNNHESAIMGDTAMDIMYDEDKWKKFHKGLSVLRLLEPRRNQDEKQTLWNVFNIVQEKFIKGSRFMVQHSDVNEAMRFGMRVDTVVAQKTKEVKSIDRDIKLNKALWSMAEKMHELKSVVG